MRSLNNKKTQKNNRLKKSVRLSTVLLPTVKPAFKKRGIDDIRLVHDWDKIVGHRLASKTVVDKITYNRSHRILHIKTVGAFATEVSYQSEYIMQKVNQYFGGFGITAIKIHHTLPFEYVQRYVQRYESATLQQDIKKCPTPRVDIAVIEHIQDENIKNSLRRMAGFVYNDT